MNFTSPKTCRSLTAECSLPPFLSWSEAILLDPKILKSGSHHKVSFPEQAAYYPTKKKKKKKEGLMEMPALFVIFSVSLVLQSMSLHPAFGIVLQNPETPT